MGAVTTEASGGPSATDSSQRARREFEAFIDGLGWALEADPTQRVVLSLTEPAVPLPPEPATLGSGLVLGPVLGRGGMGQVHLAEQITLGRQVAVKRLRDDAQSKEARRALLEEAWVSGALEHPNIVPVYDVELRDGGDPLVVMKRIEGVSWAECLADPARLPGFQPAAGAGGDLLALHLEILLQVCNAVHFAHSKRIVHRDLKPANVMIGSFGEVYLLDWGLALCLDEEVADPRFPRAAASQEIAGTPCCMAPEMVAGDGRRIDERTDVYLLGALLHEIVTGRPRHEGDVIHEVMWRAHESQPVAYDAGVPAELGAICNRATDADPDRRFPSAEAFRAAVKEFLGHRSSVELATDAAIRLAELRFLVKGCGGDGHGSAAHDLFGACRFGFQQALRIWSDNGAARRGLYEAIELMIEFELGRDNADAAAALLAELPEEPSRLSDAVTALGDQIQQKRAEIEALRRLEREHDLGRGSRTRSLACSLLGVTVFAYLLVLYYLERTGRFAWSPGTLAGHSVGTLVLFAAILALFRRALFQNQANRQVAYSLVLSGVAALLFRAAVVAGGLPIASALALEYIVWALGFGLLAVVSERKLLPASILLAAGALGVLWPRDVLVVLALSSLAAMLWVAWVWWPRQARASSERRG
jgi:eukaryotic-like serine/threonine-protein kinase